jgi:hypothetical protein
VGCSPCCWNTSAVKQSSRPGVAHTASICIQPFGVPSLGYSAYLGRERPSTIRPSPWCEPSRARFESIAMSPQIHTYTEFRQELQHDQPLRTRNVISQRPRVLVIRIQQLVAVATLGLLLWLWFGGSRHHAPQPSYPYYDTQKPVPPWSEPAPLQGNYSREGE